MVETRVEALGKLEKALTTAARASDPELVHEVCGLVWTLALPVLQPNLRRQVKRVLQSCAKTLEDMSSPLHELRAQLHLELTRGDVADDLYAAAVVQRRAQLHLELERGDVADDLYAAAVVQLHLELTRGDVADDLYAAAVVQLNKGLHLD
ncbi:hypothetical protein T484DRAFT_1786169 [Baffinella frigidus]|nr:hypothetical protein T484DRAFT_1786169 [Cryptophyta sp. CCMP2293]